MRWVRTLWSDSAAVWKVAAPKARWGLAFWGGFTVLAVVVMIVALGFVTVDEVALDVHHARAEATVIGINPGRYDDQVRVRFKPDGAPSTEAAIVYGPLSDTPHVGDRVTIEYDPGRPTRARRAGTHDILLPVAFFGLVGVLGVFATQRERLRRRRRGRRSFGRH